MKKTKQSSSSVGIVETRTMVFAKPPALFPLACGRKIGPITVAYETYGRLNKERTNTILVCHALTGDAHAAGYHSAKDRKPGWWDDMIGPGKAFDTRKYFVVCSNILGGCKGTTGPGSVDPSTGKPWGVRFPVLTVSDMVRVQKELLDHLGIGTLAAVTGGSMGGMQVLEWMARYPEMVRSTIVIASTSRLSPQAIAFDAVGRNAVISDPAWNGGNYYKAKRKPERGLAIARMIGHITYLSEESMNRKFGRKLQNKERFSYDHSAEFQVEGYLEHQGSSFVERFDPNSYLYVTRAMDYFDLAADYGGLETAFRKGKGRALIISFTSDWLFPSKQSREIVAALQRVGRDVTYCDIDSPCGHDAFLLEFRQITRLIRNFLSSGGVR
jgi:homoserine O-acetyltransferase